MTALIAAVARNGVIGGNNTIPWNIPDDRIFFKQLTRGNVLIMGRRTFLSIGTALPERITVVISRTARFSGERLYTCAGVADALTLAQTQFLKKNIFFAGGAEIYREAIPYCDALYLTEINADFPGDTFFPEFDSADFIRSESALIAQPIPHRFVTYVRKPILEKQ